MTLKTKVMVAENSALLQINYNLNCIQTEFFFYCNISVLLYFLSKKMQPW